MSSPGPAGQVASPGGGSAAGLAFALATRQPYGIWGGTSPEERTVLRNKAPAAGLADALMVS